MYSVKSNAVATGSIDDNYDALFENRNEQKTRFIRKHLPKLLEISNECETITEMGVDSVNTTWAFLKSRPKRLVSIDIVNTKAPTILELAKKLADDEGISFEFILSDTKKIEIDKTDLLFIDTEHTYKQLSAELELHADKANKYIALHDTDMFYGVWLAKEVFLHTHPEWQQYYETKESCGFTILKRK